MSRDRFSKPKPKQIDIVIYKSGDRIVIGKAELSADGALVGQIAKDVRQEIKDLFAEGIGDVSINPLQRVNYSAHVDTKTHKIHEVRVIPPLKVQETPNG